MKGLIRRFTLALCVVASTLLCVASPIRAQSQTHATVTVLTDFTDPNLIFGANPTGSLNVTADGTLYGSTEHGGANRLGTIFKIGPAGNYMVLRHMSQSDGGAAMRVTLASDGYIYGVTDEPVGAPNFFRMATDGSGFTILGALPSWPSALTEGEPGVFYGTSFYGGDVGHGTVFKVTSAGVLTHLYSFSGPDGGMPTTPVIRTEDGTLYGTTWYGGTTYGDVDLNFGLGIGTVFSLTPDGTLTVLHSFTGPDGAYPSSGLTFDEDGNLYGVARGGIGDWGTIYKIDPTGEHMVLHRFDGQEAYPYGTLQYVEGGFLYGAASGGSQSSNGIIYRIKTDGTGYAVVHDLITANVSSPSRVWLGPGDVFYGEGANQGGWGRGSVYRMVDHWLPAKQVDLALTGSAGQTDQGIVSATFEVVNRALGAALDVRVQMTVPAGATLLPEVSTPGCTLAGQLLTCGFDAVPGVSTMSLQVALQLASPQPNLPLSASVSALQPETAPNDNTVTVTTVLISGTVDLALQGAGSQTAAGLVSSVFTLSNAGDGIASGVLVTFDVPVGATLVTSESSPSCSQVGTVIRCVIGAMRAGQTSTLNVVLQLPAMRSEVLIEARASAHQSDLSDEDNVSLVDAGYAAYDYQYDGLGHLSHRSVNGGPATHVFYTKGGLLLGEYGPGGELQRENIYLGRELVAYENAGASADPTCPSSGSSYASYVITDPLSSPIAGSNACGASTWHQRYLPFGERINNVAHRENDQWFAGDYQESKTRLVNMGARQYSPLLGRFLSVDPADVDPAKVFSFNRYAYANNNPYRYVDPDGESPVELADVAGSTVGATSFNDFLLNSTEHVGTSFGENSWSLAFWNVFVGGWTDAANDASNGEYGPAVLGVGTALFKPAKSAGKIWSGTKKLSPVQNALAHWNKHRSEFPEFQNAKQYVEATRRFFANPPAGTQTFTRPNGDRLFYDTASNTFGVQNADGVPRTMFRPEEGYRYWLRAIGQ